MYARPLELEKNDVDKTEGVAVKCYDPFWISKGEDNQRIFIRRWTSKAVTQTWIRYPAIHGRKRCDLIESETISDATKRRH